MSFTKLTEAIHEKKHSFYREQSNYNKDINFVIYMNQEFHHKLRSTLIREHPATQQEFLSGSIHGCLCFIVQRSPNRDAQGHPSFRIVQVEAEGS